MVFHISSGHQMIASSSPRIRHLQDRSPPEYSGTCNPPLLNHVGVTTREEHDPDSLHPSIKHLETDMSRPGLELGPPAPQAGTLPKSYSNSLHILTILIRHSTISQFLVLCPVEVWCSPLQPLGKFPTYCTRIQVLFQRL
jgi:hypothetical protein